MANHKIEAVEGIGPKYAAMLAKAGITDTDGLLEAGCSKAGRKSCAEKSGCSESQLLKWVNMCDLFRIKGVGEEYSELLEASGVDTVKELRNRVPENLTAKMEEVNAAKNLVRKLPTLKEVTAWVEHAKKLPPKVTH
jgi:predicted flap endonuclease-1-like 5' DNA nuclease